MGPCPQDSEPVWLARPSPYGSFIRCYLDGLCGAVYIVFLQVGCYCPPKNTVLTHRLLALRYVTP
jgi:hypothetical protein